MNTTTINSESVKSLLDSNWHSNSSIGYFIDASSTTALNDVSLYDTLWWARELTQRGKPTGLSLKQVGSWLQEVLSASGASSTDMLGAPELGVLAAAIDLADIIGLTYDKGTIAERVEELRDGGGYRSSITASNVDWNSTASAIRILSTLRVEVPGEVIRHVNDTATAALINRDLKVLTTETIPVLLSTSFLFARVNGDYKQWQWAVENILSFPPEQSAILYAALPNLNVIGSHSLNTEDCEEVTKFLHAEDQKESNSVNPMMLVGLRNLDCAQDWIDPPPYAKRGWPSEIAKSRALISTYYATLLATKFDFLNYYTNKLNESIKAGLFSDSLDNGSYAGGAAYWTISSLVGHDVAPSLSMENDVKRALRNPNPQDISLLNAAVAYNIVSKNNDLRPVSMEIHSDESLAQAIALKLAQLAVTRDGLVNVTFERDYLTSQDDDNLEMVSLFSWVQGSEKSHLERSFCSQAGICSIDGAVPGVNSMEAVVLVGWKYNDSSAPAPLVL